MCHFKLIYHECNHWIQKPVLCPEIDETQLQWIQENNGDFLTIMRNCDNFEETASAKLVKSGKKFCGRECEAAFNAGWRCHECYNPNSKGTHNCRFCKHLFCGQQCYTFGPDAKAKVVGPVWSGKTIPMDIPSLKTRRNADQCWHWGRQWALNRNSESRS